ncbi:unnamed protein product [Cladocopium goreaui]|uniref:EF-hand domain-containing protein n=1 Tax=Cladocopium goreaui TaxID=2562237 RepID=A0A9P1GCF7_9DINO|nr:unnamed protein product [Cladocopium goreaui]
MQNRTLGFWAKSFSRWQVLRKQQEVSDRCTVAQLEKVFQGFARPRCLELGKLFGGVRSLSQVSFEKTFVSLPEIFTAGVLMSEIISSTNKLHFVFGLVDPEGKTSLSQKEFSIFIQNFIHGLSCAFGLCIPCSGAKEEPKSTAVSRGNFSTLLMQRRHSSAWANCDEQHRIRFAHAPTADSMTLIAQRLYTKTGISRKVARTIVKLHSTLQNDADKAALVAAVKARQQSSLSARPATTAGVRSVEQRLPFPVLLDWCFRLVQDPLAIPYALVIERFCPRESSKDDNPENFEVDESHIFHLSPASAAVDEREAAAAQYMPSRADVLAARYVYNFAAEQNYFTLTPAELEHQMSEARHTDVEYAVRLQTACAQAEEIRSKQRKPSWAAEKFLGCVRALSATPLPLGDAEASPHVREAFKTMPVLPQQEKDKIMQDFARLDVEKKGFVEVAELKRVMGGNDVVTDALIGEYDASGDGVIDKNEFFAMMCPPGYKMETSEDKEGKMLSQLLQAYMEEEQQRVCLEEERFAPAGRLRAASVSLSAAMPIVSEEKWEQWNANFRHLDQDSDGFISADDLRCFPGVFHSSNARDLTAHLYALAWSCGTAGSS